MADNRYYWALHNLIGVLVNLEVLVWERYWSPVAAKYPRIHNIEGHLERYAR